MAKTTIPDGLVPLSEGALLLGVAHQSAMRLLLTGTLKGQRIGKRWYVSRASVAEARRILKQREQAAVH